MSDRAMMYCPQCRNLAKITGNTSLQASRTEARPGRDALRQRPRLP